MPAAAVIPASIVYITAVAVKMFVVLFSLVFCPFWKGLLVRSCTIPQASAFCGRQFGGSRYVMSIILHLAVITVSLFLRAVLHFEQMGGIKPRGINVF